MERADRRENGSIAIRGRENREGGRQGKGLRSDTGREFSLRERKGEREWTGRLDDEGALELLDDRRPDAHVGPHLVLF
jgi:hypothetical protein